MTLSFTTHWRDELPDFYASLSPTPLDNARLIWRNAPLAQQLGVPDPCLRLKAGPVSGAAKRCFRACRRWRRYTAASLALGRPAGRRTRDPARRAAAGGWPPLRLASEGAGLTPYSRMGTAAPCCARRSGKVWRRRRCTLWGSRRRAHGDGDQRYPGLPRARGARCDADAGGRAMCASAISNILLSP